MLNIFEICYSAKNDFDSCNSIANEFICIITHVLKVPVGSFGKLGNLGYPTRVQFHKAKCTCLVMSLYRKILFYLLWKRDKFYEHFSISIPGEISKSKLLEKAKEKPNFVQVKSSSQKLQQPASVLRYFIEATATKWWTKLASLGFWKTLQKGSSESCKILIIFFI